MPIYKTNELYLRQAIESILKQTYSDFEFILINDSPDDELRLYDIFKSYDDERVIWISNEQNMGIARSSNIGIDYSRGEFIAMLDHDDICKLDRFEKQVRFLEKNLDYGFIGGQADAFYPDGSNVRLNYAISSSMEDLKNSFFNGVPFLNPSIMFRKSALNLLRYDPSYKVCADYDLFARLVFTEKIMATNLPDVLIEYRFHDSNTSFNQYLLGEQETNKIQQLILEQDSTLIHLI